MLRQIINKRKLGLLKPFPSVSVLIIGFSMLKYIVQPHSEMLSSCGQDQAELQPRQPLDYTKTRQARLN